MLKLVHRIYYLCLFIISFSIVCYGQQEGKYILSGIVQNSETRDVLPFVNVINESRRISSESDTDGNFSIIVREGDTLVFMLLGYLGKVIVVEKANVSRKYIINMVERTYELDEARIVAFRSYSDFKYALQNLNIPQTKTDDLREKLRLISHNTAQKVNTDQKTENLLKNNEMKIGQVSISILNSEDKQRRQLEMIVAKEKRQRQIAEKFNREIISDVTGLNGDELTEFIKFCNFSEDFILKTNQYDILVQVLEKLEHFKKLKPSGQINKKFWFAQFA